MIGSLFISFSAFLVALLPIYLWGYGSSLLLDEPWNRRRFLLGMIIGGLSVGIVWLFSILNKIEHFYTTIASFIFIFLLGTSIFLLIQYGSVFARKILQKVAIANILIITFWLVAVLFISTKIPGSVILVVTILPLLLSSLVEESSKHLMSVGLMSQDFRFSKRDIVLFTIFVVLGFVFIENLLYFFRGDGGMGTWIFRSFFSLIAHLVSAVICAYAWWKALSYPPFSLGYIAIFSIGFIGAVITHLIYNFILGEGSVMGLFLFCIVSYIVITQGILRNR
ncbi:PrsW family intramembrane metalloprotease [Candidatus Gracilibacteria bacterium]|nr:PrsW family intramembrane metalloprotease [Candidatus Gracilibacteria bacterium]